MEVEELLEVIVEEVENEVEFLLVRGVDYVA